MKVIVDDILIEDFRVQYQEQNKILEAEGDFGISIWERIRLDFIEKKAKKTCCKNDDEVIIYNENINKLIPLLDNNEIENMLMKADLNRNLGDFEECMSILNSIPGQDWIKIRFERERKNKNKNAFIIN